MEQTGAVGRGATRDLSREECMAALECTAFGRIAVSQGALPLVLPVNYAMDGPGIVFRSHQGSLLDRTCRNAVVAFEIDSYDTDTRTGWSVVAVGVANVLYASDGLRAVELGLASAGAADGAVFVKIVPGTVTGRAVGINARHESGDSNAERHRQPSHALDT
jgi:hypothetical protein